MLSRSVQSSRAARPSLASTCHLPALRMVIEGWHRMSQPCPWRRSGGSRQRQTDDGQTNSVLFHISVWPSSASPRQPTADGLTMDRRILYFLTELVWPPSAVSQRIKKSILTIEQSKLALYLYLSILVAWPHRTSVSGETLESNNICCLLGSGCAR